MQWSLPHGPPSHTASLLWRILSINREKNELISKPRLNWVHIAWRWWVFERREMKPSQESPFILRWQAGWFRCLRSSPQLRASAQLIASYWWMNVRATHFQRFSLNSFFIHSISVEASNESDGPSLQTEVPCGQLALTHEFLLHTYSIPLTLVIHSLMWSEV